LEACVEVAEMHVPPPSCCELQSPTRSNNSESILVPLAGRWNVAPPASHRYRWHPRAPSIPQQFVDRGLRPRLLVDALDNHRAIEAWARGAVLHRLARQRAWNDDRIGR